MSTSSHTTAFLEALTKALEESDLVETETDPDAAQARVEKAHSAFEREVEPIVDAVRASEQLTAADFAIRINTRS